jgi:hypothetical protein
MKIHRQGKKLSVVLDTDQLAQITLKLSTSNDVRDRMLAFEILRATKEIREEK